jgi:hypothetical protein
MIACDRGPRSSWRGLKFNSLLVIYSRKIYTSGSRAPFLLGAADNLNVLPRAKIFLEANRVCPNNYLKLRSGKVCLQELS